MSDWLQLAHLMYTSTDVLLIILRDVSSGLDWCDASARLTALKGPAAPEMRTRDQLRERLCPPNEIFNFLHTADEPADVLRELGIVLERESRRRLFAAMLTPCFDADTRERALAEIVEVESESEAHDFDFDQTIQRVSRDQRLDRDSRARLIAAAAGGDKLSWDELSAVINPRDERVRLWDFIVIGCSVLEL